MPGLCIMSPPEAHDTIRPMGMESCEREAWKALSTTSSLETHDTIRPMGIELHEREAWIALGSAILDDPGSANANKPGSWILIRGVLVPI